MDKNLDMDGNELKVGDKILFATNAKIISRGVITDINDIGVALILTLKNRHSRQFCERLLLDTTGKED